ncbi:MAG: glucosamine-6-phosphate deaminase [Tenericutes bacterium]|nr:glucosamine-6-phosphate deaminase [Mycoplasmatota bacterium]
MEVIIVNTALELASEAAKFIKNEINTKPNLVLGLATGDTPLMTYDKLVEFYQAGLVDFSKVRTFNLDEYVGLHKSDLNSYYYYMHHNFFDKINIQEENIHLLDGFSEDFNQLAKNYDKLIYENKGIDLQLLGIGINGHIGFNEPDVKLEINTHVTGLTEETLNQNSKFFPNIEQMPKQAITMGLGTIMRAKKILLIATGARKAEIMARFLEDSSISTSTPASTLLLHQNLTIMMDLEAARLYLKEKKMTINENNNQEYKNIIRRFSTI